MDSIFDYFHKPTNAKISDFFASLPILNSYSIEGILISLGQIKSGLIFAPIVEENNGACIAQKRRSLLSCSMD